MINPSFLAMLDLCHYDDTLICIGKTALQLFESHLVDPSLSKHDQSKLRYHVVCFISNKLLIYGVLYWIYSSFDGPVGALSNGESVKLLRGWMHDWLCNWFALLYFSSHFPIPIM